MALFYSVFTHRTFTMRRGQILFVFIFLVATMCLLTMSLMQTSSKLTFSPTNQSGVSIVGRVEIVHPYYDNRFGEHCRVSLYWGEMCPELYTELGGKCNLMDGLIQCPDIRNHAKFRNRQAQLVMTRMLRIFDLIAQKHSIDYWICGGTLLGAARHHGFIPWDYDIDIEMPLDEYEKFFQFAAKDLPPDIFFQNSVSDPALNPDDPSGYHNHETVGIYEATWNPRLRDRNSCYKFCFSYGCTWHDGLMVDIFVSPHMNRSAAPRKRINFEGFTFPVQNDWEEYLLENFGEQYFEVPTDQEPKESPDVFHGCEELKGSSL